MRDRRTQWKTMVFATFLILFSIRLIMAQTPSPTPPPGQTPVQSEDIKPPAATPSGETPDIDPDVKQWFLERLKKQNPLDPKDVDVLTGRARDAERMAEFQNYMNNWGAFGWASSPYWQGPMGLAYQSRFLSPGFTLFGNRHGLKGRRFSPFAPLFRPFGMGNGPFTFRDRK